MSNKTYFSFNEKNLPEYISIVSASRCARIRIEDIEIIEQEGRKIHIITAERDYSYYEKMNTLAMSLGNRAFYRVMKGLIINFDHVKEIKGYYIIFNSGKVVTMGKNNMSKAKQAYKRYLLHYPPYTTWLDLPGVAEQKLDSLKENIIEEYKNEKNQNNVLTEA